MGPRGGVARMAGLPFSLESRRAGFSRFPGLRGLGVGKGTGELSGSSDEENKRGVSWGYLVGSRDEEE